MVTPYCPHYQSLPPHAEQCTGKFWNTPAPPRAQTSSHILLPSPCWHSRSPVLNPILMKPTHLNSQFKQVGTTICSTDQFSFSPVLLFQGGLTISPFFAFSLAQSFTQAHTRIAGETHEDLNLVPLTMHMMHTTNNAYEPNRSRGY